MSVKTHGPVRPKVKDTLPTRKGAVFARACCCSCGLQAQLWQHTNILTSPHAANIDAYLAGSNIRYLALM